MATFIDTRDARILIIDDQEPNVRLLQGILKRAGYRNLGSTIDSREALSVYDALKPDLILLDLMMPEMDGFEVMEQLRVHAADQRYLPILVLTADVTIEAKQRALSTGAKDFLTKPFEPTEVLLRVENLLETRALYLQLQNHNQILEGRVQERTHDLEEAQVEILERLAHAAEYRDDDTGKHTERVGQLCAIVAHAIGLPDDRVRLLRKAAPLHDVGKIGISDTILLKPGRLTAEEFEVMKRHAIIGAALLANGRSPLTQMAERIALTHHERWDGSGYPHGLAGDQIPIEGRIVAVVDVFDALTHERPYKHAWTVDEALFEIASKQGTQFDPQVVEVFLGLLRSGAGAPVDKAFPSVV